jgi:hypothetical protein
MNQYTVPQFIDVEDKIFGPVTTRQFGIMISALGPIFLAYKMADLTLFAFLTFVIGSSAIILAFVKINGQPFHYFLLNLFTTFKKPSRRVWNRQYDNAELKEYMKKFSKPEEKQDKIERKSISNSRIKDLSLLVNTGGYYKAE